MLALSPRDQLRVRVLNALQSGGFYLKAQSDNPANDTFFVLDPYRPGLSCQDVKEMLGEELAPKVHLDILLHEAIPNRVRVTLLI